VATFITASCAGDGLAAAYPSSFTAAYQLPCPTPEFIDLVTNNEQ
jgi:hypothetical protein